ncbi:hypothetical protein XM38_003780 [Halomicronema hongdechloris C2206]|uniref:HNH nuclease domain-containing protein n=1 Tax=Halomicronema hongdechloris C2206 TaxID=1641165 RepID=A0A1Z3HGP5_9CYAN|nr:hypothetical protein XM38_003780 [Halomicronema hongdechloris C2206]
MNPLYAAVAERANHRCEYCQAPEVVFSFPFEVEHSVPLARQGPHDKTNLALAYRSCNLRKGLRISGTTSGGRVLSKYPPHYPTTLPSGKPLRV